jgi:peptidoglycan/LPS O-acetylase OafA/YrhL
MYEFVNSLSLASGSVIVAAVSALLAFATGRIENAVSRRVSVFLVPVAASYCLYWSPVWLGADSAEYSAWWGLFVIPWSFVGVMASAAVTAGVQQYLKTKGAKHA